MKKNFANYELSNYSPPPPPQPLALLIHSPPIKPLQEEEQIFFTHYLFALAHLLALINKPSVVVALRCLSSSDPVTLHTPSFPQNTHKSNACHSISHANTIFASLLFLPTKAHLPLSAPKTSPQLHQI